MIDIFTAFLGIISILALAGATFKILTKQPKVWDEEWSPEDIEMFENYDELRKEKPHIWMS